MARYIKEFPIVDYPETSFAEINRYLTEKKFVYKNRDGEMLFQKGKGFWTAPSFIKVTYLVQTVRVEAWIDVMGGDQDLEGFVGCAVKKPLKNMVNYVEYLLQRANPAYLQYKAETVEEEVPAIESEPQQAPVLPASKKEYYKKYAAQGFYYNLRITAILGYVLCGISALTALVNPFVLLDVLIFLGLTLGMHLGKSKGCAIGITVYAALSMALVFAMTDTIGGWAWLIVGIYGIILFNNADKRYRKMMEQA